MPSFLVEAYLADRAEGLEDARARAQRAADAGAGVRYVRTTFLPSDQTVFHLFEAPSVEALGAASRAAALTVDRIVEAVEPPSA